MQSLGRFTSRLRRHWFLAATCGATGVLIAASVSGSFPFDRLVQSARDSVMGAQKASWHTRLELGIGRLPLGAIRWVSGFFPIDARARAAAEAVRSVRVGVYQLPEGEALPDPGTLLSSLDRSLGGRGWDRSLEVVDGRTVVAAYVREGWMWSGLKVCLVILNERNLVVVSGQVKLDPLMDLLRQLLVKQVRPAPLRFHDCLPQSKTLR